MQESDRIPEIAGAGRCGEPFSLSSGGPCRFMMFRRG